MSLIPSESYSFPDHFTRTVSHSRNQNGEKSRPSPVKPEAPRQKSPLPWPAKPQEPQNLAPALPSPVAAVRNSTSLPPANSVSDVSQSGTTARSVGLAEFMRILQASSQPVEIVDAPQPSAPVPTLVDQEADFDMFAPQVERLPERRRRSPKFIRFMTCEAVAIGVLIPLAIIGLSRMFTDPTLVMLINIFTIAAAVVTAIIPIIFFALGPTLPQDESASRF